MSGVILTAKVSALRAALTLTTPLAFLPGDGTRRELAIVTIRDTQGNPYYGEIAPLPTFSVETLDDALSELATSASTMPPLEEASIPLSDPWKGYLDTLHCASVRCGVEGALLDYMVRSGSIREHTRHQTIQCNALILAGDEERIRGDVATKIAHGFRTLKVKISPKSAEPTLRALRSVDLPVGTRLRLDANRSFTVAEWSKVAEALKALPPGLIEYVEEPVNEPGALPEIIMGGGLPIAIDETARELPVEEWLQWKPATLVVKPMLNGGLISLLSLFSRMRESGASITLSSSFESGIGLRSIVLLASMVENCGAIGVDTASFLREDLMDPPFPKSVPVLEVEGFMRPPSTIGDPA